ncbi:hypothetical protein EGR_04868 [Echinococcus granulosus]|uniref:Transmembrane protein n=1 Tax=Echinococcus granulosus TaxID=6210 RepID=W6UFT1_ECHGR|nr:hypothetical protein EGR_04868 [Echinococcus granulosus]EUB60310.1 hypothetical protein EGR_04868 [Echinococcus granulosus]
MLTDYNKHRNQGIVEIQMHVERRTVESSCQSLRGSRSTTTIISAYIEGVPLWQSWFVGATVTMAASFLTTPFLVERKKFGDRACWNTYYASINPSDAIEEHRLAFGIEQRLLLLQ